MRKQIEQIKKIISESEPVQTSQPKISLFFAKKSKPRQIVNQTQIRNKLMPKITMSFF